PPDVHLPDPQVHHSQAAIQLFHQLASPVDHLEDVDALFVVANLVGQPLAAPVLGLLNPPVHPRHDGLDLCVQLGDPLVGRVGGGGADALVLPNRGATAADD